MPLRDPTGKRYDGLSEEWSDEAYDGDSEEPPVDDEGAGGLGETSGDPDIEMPEDGILFEGERDPETGMRPVVMEKLPAKSPSVPAVRGRHVGAKALALLSRMPLVGLKWMAASQEFVVYDNQPPPSGEYAVQALGVTTIEYNGVKQNHLLVTFKSGQLTGFGVEDTYLSYEATFGAIVTDEPIDIQTLLGVRSGRTVALFASKDIKIRFNTDTDPSITIAANQCPFVIDLGLNINWLFLSTLKDDTKIKLVGW